MALSLQAVDDEGFGVGTFNASLAVDVKRSALAMDGKPAPKSSSCCVLLWSGVAEAL
jgi:hypothetical protein